MAEMAEISAGSSKGLPWCRRACMSNCHPLIGRVRCRATAACCILTNNVSAAAKEPARMKVSALSRRARRWVGAGGAKAARALASGK